MRPKANLLAVHRDWGVALSRKANQFLFLAVLIALKYRPLEMLATSCRAGVPCLVAVLEACGTRGGGWLGGETTTVWSDERAWIPVYAP